jgi:hypothetical protein
MVHVQARINATPIDKDQVLCVVMTDSGLGEERFPLVDAVGPVTDVDNQDRYLREAGLDPDDPMDYRLFVNPVTNRWLCLKTVDDGAALSHITRP